MVTSEIITLHTVLREEILTVQRKKGGVSRERERGGGGRPSAGQ